MFAKKFSLSKKELRVLKTEAKLIQSDIFAVLVNKRDLSLYPRFAVVISNKVAKLATHRNRVRRSFRDVLRRNWKKIDGRYDIIFLVKPGIEKLPVSEIMKKIEIFIDNKGYVKRSPKN